MVSQRVALVTGGTRRIGLAIAQRLARENYCLALNFLHNQEEARAAEQALLAQGHEVILVRGDVGQPDGAAAVVETVLRHFQRLDLLVNNVGPFVPKPLAETTVDDWEVMLHGVLGSVFHMSRLVVPPMRAQGGGCIITLGSLNAEMARGAPNAAVYHALKSAAVVLTRSLARTEGPHGIRANVVNPGMVDTLGVDPEAIVKSIPLRRLGEADEIAAAVAWLASDEAAYVNGAVLNVHGGLWA